MVGDDIGSIEGSSPISMASKVPCTSTGPVLFVEVFRVTAFLVLGRPLEVAASRTLAVDFNRRDELRGAGDDSLVEVAALIGEADLGLAVLFTGDFMPCVTSTKGSSNGRSNMALVILLDGGFRTGEVDLALECGLFAGKVDLIRAATCSVDCFIGDVDLVLGVVFFDLSGVRDCGSAEVFRGDACPVERVVFKGDPGPTDNEQSSPS